MSRNQLALRMCVRVPWVAPREGRVSRNDDIPEGRPLLGVAPREGRVSRNCSR